MSGRDLRKRIMEIIEINWPAHVKEIVRNLGYEINNSNIKKVCYHIKVLEKHGNIRMKRIGRSLVVWPMGIERLRLVYELIKE